MRKVRWTFNLPNFQDRVIQGSGTRGNVGTYKSESLPNIKNTTPIRIASNDQNVGEALYVDGKHQDTSYAGLGQNNVYLYFDASRSSSTYQNSAPVQQNALLIQCCIKY